MHAGQRAAGHDQADHMDERAIYGRLPAWGSRHKAVCHGRSEYARDEDADGFCAVCITTMEKFWSLLRSWQRPHRSIPQNKLPLHLGFFQPVHSARRRGKPCPVPSSRAWSLGASAANPELDRSRSAIQHRGTVPCSGRCIAIRPCPSHTRTTGVSLLGRHSCVAGLSNPL